MIKETILKNLESFSVLPEKIQSTGNRINELNPTIPDDGTCGFIAFTQGDKRIKIKTGRFLTSKLELKDVILDTQIQQIADNLNKNLFGTAVSLVKGKAITSAYNSELGGYSCMTGSSSEYTLLYEQNPDIYQMAIILQGKDSARAIVAKLDCGEFYLDSQYGTCESLKKDLVNFAIKQGWFYYVSGHAYFNGENCTKEQKEKLVISNLTFENGHVPYMDSFTTGTIKKGKLYLYHRKLNHSYGFDVQSTCGKIQEDDSPVCCSCDSRVNENNVHNVDGDYYCESCYDDSFGHCEHCENDVRQDDIYCLGKYGMSICNDCLENHFYQCRECNQYFKENDVHTIGDSDNFVCDSCLDNYGTCEECDTLYHCDDLTLIESSDKHVCNSCKDDLYHECESCGEFVKEVQQTTKGKDVCLTCYMDKYSLFTEQIQEQHENENKEQI